MSRPKIKYQIINRSKKIIQIGCGNNSCKFQLKKKRAFDVLVKILEVYPELLDIHKHLDDDFNDPNRAYGDLKNEEGYEPYIKEGRNENKSMTLAIDVEKLCKYCTSFDDGPIYLGVSDQRKTLSKDEQKTIFEESSGRCNITNIPLSERRDLPSNTFCKISKTVNYDHRIPQFKGGGNHVDNFQIISELANREKNKICKDCPNAQCQECALAYPENHAIIYPTKQDITELRVYAT